MNWTPEREEAVFQAALSIASPAERAAYLTHACGGDGQFEERVRCLLGHAESTEDNLLGPDEDPDAEDAQSAYAPGMVIDRYRLVRRMGDGAMGVVFAAEQLRPFHKVVALKVIKTGMDTEEVAKRFNAERQMLATLDHPHIARVLDGGTTPGGRPYFVMELVEGESIVTYCTQHGLGLRARLELFLKVCQAMQHAHQRGIIHRDLKDANILVKEVDGKPVPVVIDFGVAKVLHQSIDDRTLATRPGQVLGTPAYMSPEQLAETEYQIDTRTDVYALGALLYQLTTNSIPFPKTLEPRTGWLEIQRIIVQDAPERPSIRLRRQGAALNHELATFIDALRQELDWVILQALEKNPDRRYQSVGELGADIQRHLDFLPVTVRPRRWPYAARQFLKRHRTLSAAVLVVLGVILIAGLQVIRRTNETQAALTVADAAVIRLENQLALSARDLLDADRTGEGLELLADLLQRRPHDAGLGAWLINELTYRSFPQPVLPPMRHPDIVYAAHFSPDGSQLLTTCIDNAARVFDAATGRERFPPLRHDPGAVTPGLYDKGLHALQANYNRNGTLIATASCDRRARVWDAATGEPRTPFLLHPDLVSFAIFTPDGSQLVTGCKDGVVRFWDLATGELVGPVLRHERWVNCAEFSPDGELLATGADDRTTRLWRWRTRTPVGSPLRDEHNIQQTRFSPDGRWILTTGSPPRARLWEYPESGALAPRILAHEDNVPFGAFSADGQWVATASFDRTARVWSPHDGRLQATLEHEGTVRMVQFHPNGRVVLTASEDHTARLWETESGRPAMQPMRHKGIVWSARFSPTGNRVATASADGTAMLWDVRPGQAQPVVLANDNRVSDRQDWSADGKWVATTRSRNAVWRAADGRRAGEAERWPQAEARYVRFHPREEILLGGTLEGFAEVWDYPPAKTARLRLFHGEGHVKVEWSPGADRFITAANEPVVRVWQYPSGNPLEPAMWHTTNIHFVAQAPNGLWIASGLVDGTICLWDAANHSLLTSWKAHDARIEKLHFSANGRRLISASPDAKAAVWDLPEGTRVGDYLHHEGAVTDATLSADGRLAVTASRDGTARRWSVDESRLLQPVARHRGPVVVASMDSANELIVTGSEDRTARVWSLETGHPVTPYLLHNSRVRNAQFSPGGDQILVSSDGNPSIWSFARPAGDPPAWLLELAHSLARQTTPTADAMSNSLDTIPASIAARSFDDSTPWDRWHQWFHTDRLDRAHAPGAALPIRELTDGWLHDPDSIWDPVRQNLLFRALQFQPESLIGQLHAEVVRLKTAQGATAGHGRSTEPALSAGPEGVVHPITAWRQALGALHGGQIDQALAALGPFLKRDVDNPMFWMTAAQVLWESGDHAGAGNAFVKAVQELNEPQNGYLPDLYRRWALNLWARQRRGANASSDLTGAIMALNNIAPRGNDLPAELIDLSAYFQHGLVHPWLEHERTFYTFQELRHGVQTIAGVPFDVRGMVQLAGRGQSPMLGDIAESRAYLAAYSGPQAGDSIAPSATGQISGLPLSGLVRRIHALMSAHGEGDSGEIISRMAVTYADGSTSTRDIRYGTDLRSWISDKHGTIMTPQPAWIGATHTLRKLRLYVVTWENQRPDQPVARLDIAAGLGNCSPLLMAITAER